MVDKLTSWQVDKWTSCLWSRHGNMVDKLTSWQVDKWTSCLWSRHGNMVDKLTSRQVDKWTSCLRSRHGNMRTNFFFITSNLSTYLVTLSLFASNLFTCPLIMLLCLWYNQLVHPSTRSLVHLLCYSVFFASNLFTRSLVNSSTYLVTLSFCKQLVHSSTRSLVH